MTVSGSEDFRAELVRGTRAEIQALCDEWQSFAVQRGGTFFDLLAFPAMPATHEHRWVTPVALPYGVRDWWTPLAEEWWDGIRAEAVFCADCGVKASEAR